MKNTLSHIDKERISRILEEKDVVLFMKGNVEAPRCGFSSNVLEILLNYVNKDDIKCCDVLCDPWLRENIKIFNNWPTFPQLFFKKSFIGGHDILLQLHKEGKLEKYIKNQTIKKNS